MSPAVLCYFLTAGPVWLWCLWWHRNPRGISVSCFLGLQKSLHYIAAVFFIYFCCLCQSELPWEMNDEAFSQFSHSIIVSSGCILVEQWLSRDAALCMWYQNEESERDSSETEIQSSRFNLKRVKYRLNFRTTWVSVPGAISNSRIVNAEVELTLTVN